MQDELKRLLQKVARGKTSVRDACAHLRDLPFKDIRCAKLDTHRLFRKGFPEVIYAPGKLPAELEKITSHFIKLKQPVFITKADQRIYNYLKDEFKGLKFSERAGIIHNISLNKKRRGSVLVLSAGTADVPIAEEAALTAEAAGCNVERLYDVGVAGIHRVFSNKKKIDRAAVLIVVAGMEGALASVVGGITDRPVIAVPTSVGYGANFKGIAPLLTMLNCCAPGVVVVNIDNGFGAGYFASLIAKR